MSVPSNIHDLSALFRKLGASDPESWAKSQLDEDIPQLHRFLFLRQAWRSVLPEDAAHWIKQQIASAEKQPRAPFAGVGAALQRARAAGVSDDDLSAVARGAQVELLFALCYMLEDNGLDEPELQGIGWGLFETDTDGNAGEPIFGLHESVLEMDPTGREMRPNEA